jgi:hypothetical protein
MRFLDHYYQYRPNRGNILFNQQLNNINVKKYYTGNQTVRILSTHLSDAFLSLLLLSLVSETRCDCSLEYRYRFR